MEEQQAATYSRGLENAGFVLALISIAACVLLYLSIPFGVLAIILTLLSRGNGRLRPRAKLAVAIAAGTITASSCMTGFYTWRIMSDPALKTEFFSSLEYYTRYYSGTLEPEDAGSLPASENMITGTLQQTPTELPEFDDKNGGERT